jgi:cytoskeleton protein RodZ
MYSPPLESPAVDGEAVDANEGGLDADVPVPEPEVEAEAEIETVSVEPVADQLALSFQEACWLRVRDGNGEELYVGQRDAGQNLQLQGTGPFRITLGNAAAVSAITFNGAAVRVPQAEPGQVVTVRAQ